MFFTAKLQKPLQSLYMVGEAFKNAQPCPNSSFFKTNDKTAIEICGEVKIPKLSPSHHC